MGGGLVAVGQVLRGMQRTGGEGWTAVVLQLRGWGGDVRCCVCVLPCVVCWSRRVLGGRKNRTVKGFNIS